MTITTQTVLKDPRTLISDDLFDKLVQRVRDDEGLTCQHAARVVEQTLVYLVARSQNMDTRFSPSRAVDPGWHAFILHTEDYAAFCDQIAGRFIHHRPATAEELTGKHRGADVHALLEATGYRLDMDLWDGLASCGPCCD